jgi:diketogulonate reductase-like aldo/keto reductase
VVQSNKASPSVTNAKKLWDVSEELTNIHYNFHGDTVVVTPGASKVRHTEQNVGAMTFTLTDAELSQIDNLSKQFM